MSEFKTNFLNINKDIDRWRDLYVLGTPDMFSWRGRDKAEEFVYNLYFEHEAWDALVDHFVNETTATVWPVWPWSVVGHQKT